MLSDRDRPRAGRRTDGGVPRRGAGGAAHGCARAGSDGPGSHGPGRRACQDRRAAREARTVPAGPPSRPRRSPSLSTAAGRAATVRRAAATFSSTSRRSRAGTSQITWSPSPRSRYDAQGTPPRRSGQRSASKPTPRSPWRIGWSASRTSRSPRRASRRSPKDQTREVVTEIDNAFPDDERVIGLDRVLAAIDRSQIMPKNVEGVKADPPKIFFSKKPAVLVNLDGKAIWSPIKDNDLKYAVNTNWDLFQHEPSRAATCASSPRGSRPRTSQDPGCRRRRYRRASRSSPRRQLEGSEGGPPGQGARRREGPDRFVSKEPAELILLDGEPKYAPVAGGGQSPVGEQHRERRVPPGRGDRSTTSSPAAGSAPPTSMVRGPSRRRACRKSSRRSRSSTRAPACWPRCRARRRRSTPCCSPRCRRPRASSKEEIKAPEVAYAGEPKFEPIEKTSLQRAINTDKAIIKVGDMYYMCFEGVWFMGSSPTGPWEVTDSVPGEIYQIPVSSPVHNVTYVTVEDHDDEWVPVRGRGRLHRHDDRLGLRGLGIGLVLPAVLRLVRRLSRLLPVLPDLRLRRLLQPVDRRVRPAVAYGPYGGAG